MTNSLVATKGLFTDLPMSAWSDYRLGRESPA